MYYSLLASGRGVLVEEVVDRRTVSVCPAHSPRPGVLTHPRGLDPVHDASPQLFGLAVSECLHCPLRLRWNRARALNFARSRGSIASARVTIQETTWNPEVAGSNPAPATKHRETVQRLRPLTRDRGRSFLLSRTGRGPGSPAGAGSFMCSVHVLQTSGKVQCPLSLA